MKKRQFDCSGFVLISALLLLGSVSSWAWGDYRIKTVPLLPMESYPAQFSVGQVTVAVDPYPTDEKSYTAFDVKNLNSRGYFPVHVIIQNSSQSTLSLRTRDITLISKDGQELFITPATLVVQDVIKGGLKVPKFGSDDRTTAAKTGSPLKDFTDKELTHRVVDPGSTVHGFIFFYTPNGKKNLFTGSSLKIPHLIDEASQKNIGPVQITLDPALSTTPVHR